MDVLQIPELLAYICNFLEGQKSLRSLRAALGVAVCQPADCVTRDPLLWNTCRSFCAAFARQRRGHHLLQRTIGALFHTSTSTMARHCSRCVMNMQLMLHARGMQHSIGRNTVRFTQRADGSTQWWLQKAPRHWLPLADATHQLCQQFLPLLLSCQPPSFGNADAMIAMGFNVTGQADVLPACQTKLAIAFHTHLARICEPELRHTPIVCTTPWIGYYFVAGRVLWT